MRFLLVDRIVDLVPGKRIQAIKNLTMGEEYLADHFPSFPVMPGVLMLEALVQTAAWLWRVTDDFAASIYVLREAKGVKYGTFVQPGGRLRLTVESVEEKAPVAGLATFKGSGELDGVSAVTGRVVLARYDLADQDARLQVVDEELKQAYRRSYALLRPKPTMPPPMDANG